jgi:methylenetetrahydrofolate reductase (NADPH)
MRGLVLRPDASGSNFRRVLESGRFAVTTELTPPLSGDPRRFLDKALPLRGLADAVNITDGASARTHMSALAAAVLLIQHDIEPILQFTCRDRNRIALQSDVLGAAALGIRNLLFLRGDDSTAGDEPEAKAVFDCDSRQLIERVAIMRDRSRLLSGRAVDGVPEFFIGGADTPIDPPNGWYPQALSAKIAAGAHFVQTQFCMDVQIVRRYTQCLIDCGLMKRIYLLIGIAPLASARSAQWMRQRLHGTIIPKRLVERMSSAADRKLEGRRICVELIEELQKIPGVSGAHVMAPLNEAAVPEVLKEFRNRSGQHTVQASQSLQD